MLEELAELEDELHRATVKADKIKSERDYLLGRCSEESPSAPSAPLAALAAPATESESAAPPGELQALHDQLTWMATQLESAQADRAGLQSQLLATQADLADKCLELADSTDRMQAYDGAHAALACELRSAETEVTRLRSELAAVRAAASPTRPAAPPLQTPAPPTDAAPQRGGDTTWEERFRRLEAAASQWHEDREGSRRRAAPATHVASAALDLSSAAVDRPDADEIESTITDAACDSELLAFFALPTDEQLSRLSHSTHLDICRQVLLAKEDNTGTRWRRRSLVVAKVVRNWARRVGSDSRGASDAMKTLSQFKFPKELRSGDPDVTSAAWNLTRGPFLNALRDCLTTGCAADDATRKLLQASRHRETGNSKVESYVLELLEDPAGILDIFAPLAFDALVYKLDLSYKSDKYGSDSAENEWNALTARGGADDLVTLATRCVQAYLKTLPNTKLDANTIWNEPEHAKKINMRFAECMAVDETHPDRGAANKAKFNELWNRVQVRIEYGSAPQADLNCVLIASLDLQPFEVAWVNKHKDAASAKPGRGGRAAAAAAAVPAPGTPPDAETPAVPIASATAPANSQPFGRGRGIPPSPPVGAKGKGPGAKGAPAPAGPAGRGRGNGGAGIPAGASLPEPLPDHRSEPPLRRTRPRPREPIPAGALLPPPARANRRVCQVATGPSTNGTPFLLTLSSSTSSPRHRLGLLPPKRGLTTLSFRAPVAASHTPRTECGARTPARTAPSARSHRPERPLTRIGGTAMATALTIRTAASASNATWLRAATCPPTLSGSTISVAVCGRTHAYSDGTAASRVGSTTRCWRRSLQSTCRPPDWWRRLHRRQRPHHSLPPCRRRRRRR